MASLHRDISINASADSVWAIVRDFGAVQKLAPGFVVNAKLDGDARVVTFANGNVAREMLVDCDEARRRLVYAISNERVKHYNAVVEVIGDGAVAVVHPHLAAGAGPVRGARRRWRRHRHDDADGPDAGDDEGQNGQAPLCHDDADHGPDDEQDDGWQRRRPRSDGRRVSGNGWRHD